ncbi:MULTISPECIES: efflux RND transporter periplasmic adaptor subunit [unclassified Guyparkeria]|uniref:efflux RND transporter periplasmic adaptor subunit n=1 Tax=unclassified Guyparkeria TaxID=2626246 RepID=UPI0007338FF2|nr:MULTISPECIES: efflux RND transporter periplasmic adaptor subunit [unclassified Guyparkeria]KTG17796.1 hypothetical protein AUR63_06665 [Guyparkeria sp. XI15]OAE89507.1 hypothetical protein AWR35_06675 [Guyparkeria sp. WRN-7]
MLPKLVRPIARANRPGLPLMAIALLLAPTLAAQAQSGGQKPPPPKVPVITVETADAAVHKEYPGRTEANRHVEVRAQVDGILESREYTEGARVEKGDPLFRIDARPYEAAVHEAEADLAAARATLAAARRDWRRIDSLFDRGVASEKQRDDARSALETAQAGVKVAEAQLESAQVDLDYTTVSAPIPGIAGRRAVAAGNLIEVGDRLVSLDEIDPIQIVLSYPLDDPFADSQALNPTPDRPTPAEVVGITGPDGQPLAGKLDYRTAAIDEQTNSIRLRGVFANPGDVLRPNRYVRVRIRVATVSDAIIVPETAIGTGPEPGSTVIYVVGEDGTAQQKRVQLGPMSDQGRIVESGLSAGERLVIDGLLKVRPGAPVNPQTPSDETSG